MADFQFTPLSSLLTGGDAPVESDNSPEVQDIPEGALAIDGEVVAQFDPVLDTEGKIVQRGGQLFQFVGGQLTPLGIEADRSALDRQEQIQQLQLDKLRAEAGLPVSDSPTNRGRSASVSGSRSSKDRLDAFRERRDEILERQLLGAFAGLPQHQQEQLMQAVQGDPSLAAVIGNVAKVEARGRARAIQNEFRKLNRVMQSSEVTPEQRSQLIDQFVSKVAESAVEPSVIAQEIAEKDASNPTNVIARLNDKIREGEPLDLSDIIYPDPETGKHTIIEEFMGSIEGTPQNARAKSDLMKAQAEVMKLQNDQREQELKFMDEELKAFFPELEQKNPHDPLEDPDAFQRFQRMKLEQIRDFNRIRRQRRFGGTDALPQPAPTPAPPANAPEPIRVDAQTRAQPFRVKMEGVTREQLPQLVRQGRLSPGDRIRTNTGALAEIKPDGTPRLVRE